MAKRLSRSERIEEMQALLTRYGEKKMGIKNKPFVPLKERKKHIMLWLKKQPKDKIRKVIGDDVKRRAVVRALQAEGILSPHTAWEVVLIDEYIRELPIYFYDYEWSEEG